MFSPTVTLKVSSRSSVLYNLLFSGEDTIMVINDSASGLYGHQASTLLISSVPTIGENRSAEMNTAINSVFFSTGNPCLILDFFGCKSVFVKVS